MGMQGNKYADGLTVLAQQFCVRCSCIHNTSRSMLLKRIFLLQ